MNKGNENEILLKQLAIKQCILSLFAVGSTIFLSILVAAFHMTQIFANCDIIVSSTSIILMYKWNERMFTFFCHCCLRCKKDTRSITTKTLNTDKGRKRVNSVDTVS